MKVALIAPPYPLEGSAFSPPWGSVMWRQPVKPPEQKWRFFDYIVSRYSPEKLKRQLDMFQPDIVGSTAVTMNFPAGAEILRTAKCHPAGPQLP